MKMNELIDKVSILYREERNKVVDLENELNSILITLTDKGEDITLGEYNRIVKRDGELVKEIELKKQYCDGISCVRELLMSLGFGTEIE